MHDSARKNGILSEDVIKAATSSLWVEDLDDDSPARQLRLRFDTQGRLLDAVVLIFDSGNELVIRANESLNLVKFLEHGAEVRSDCRVCSGG
ncbi:hypothetical protein FB472_1502 [Rhodoglobus vestalii]|uniref:Uncharacterized protein n=1 Tax=Rhodoglobus vestalii TaxID=193384 RepID=A0A8H2K919_9MICO|nr:hypothetical protein FB472_1502 [Rhodoglobus vestalii]